jgi:uncharacterized protein
MMKRWRRLDDPGLEILRVEENAHGIEVTSNLTFGGEPSFALSYEWSLDANWRTRTLMLEVAGPTHRVVKIERRGHTSWSVDGAAREDLDGCHEVDVSATPFCNALAIRRLGGQSGEITALYVSVPELSIESSCQRYERRDDRHWRYIDLGAVKGFEADLELDEDRFVRRYQGLFEGF